MNSISITAGREPNGRASRSDRHQLKACSPAEVRRLRDAALSGMTDERWGTEIGRLYLSGKIGAPQFEAGRRWRGLAGAHSAAIGTPAGPRACTGEQRGHGHPVDADSAAGEREAAEHREAVAKFDQAKDALLQGVAVSDEAKFLLRFRAIVEADETVAGHDQLLGLDAGLSRLAYHFGLLIERKRRG